MKKKSLLLTAVATLGLTAATMAQNVPSYVPTNGLVGWWPFNGNANDESGNGNNGTVNGAALTTDRFGNANAAYDFDGVNDFVQVAHSSSLTFQSDVTFSFWLYQFDYSLNTSGLPERQPIGKQRNTNTTGIGFETVDALGSCCGPQFYITPNPQYEDASPMLLQTWVHLVGTYDGSTLNLFLNGTLLGSATGTANLSTIVADLFFGKEGALGRAYKGHIDDIGIWNRALTQQEITNLYNAGICYQYVTVTDTLLINTNLTGFNPVTYQNTIRIYPNPSNDHITIDYGNFASLNGYQLLIENSLGQQMFQTAINQQSNYISLASWSGNGIYFVHIIDPQGNTIDIRKIVLQ
ncbi:hypothetical protein LBMAG25_15720 [Bacteroidota bacterium]|nr:hypothetical protein LBMAG25_15720 [Bacteroidota bacterium]